LIGTGERLPAPSAALANGTLAHALDFDDTHLPSVLHPSACVVPAALAAAEAADASGLDLLRAVAIGDEICVRLGMAGYDPEARNSIFFDKGFHATSICGALGASAAAGVILGLRSEAIADALGIAASMGAGIIEANRTGGSVKRIHCGWAAHSGLVAAHLASHGVTGPPTVLEGRFGFFNAFTNGRFQKAAIVDGLGDRWELDRVFYKPYPANHFTHAGIDAALALRARGLDPAEVVRIELGVAEPTLRTIAEPASQKARPPTPYAAKFSGPFTVAVALLGGSGLGVGHEDFTAETTEDPEHLRLAGLVECHADPEATEVFPHQFPAVLRVTTRGGSVWDERVRHNRGGPDNPLTREELTAKYRTNAAGRISAAAIQTLEDLVWGLDQLPSLREVMSVASRR
jgi:2-methylcitrate dehydratase PrpD